MPSRPNPPGPERVESDESLVERCRLELPYRTQAFEKLVRRHEPMLFAVCRRMLGDQHEAEEAVQDVLLRVFGALPRFEGRASLRTWLYRIAVNVCSTHGQRAQRERERRDVLSRLHVEQGGGEGVEDPQPQEGAGLDATEGPAGEALRALAEDDRRALVLRHLAGLTFEELAEVLGLGLSAAKMRLYRAEERFRESFRRVQSAAGPPGPAGAVHPTNCDSGGASPVQGEVP